MKKNIVILHGWQSKIERWQDFEKRLKKYFKVYLPILPGFGEEKLSCPFSLNDYCTWLKTYLKNQKIDNPILVGHSFGGRLAIKFATQNNEVEKLILIAAAGIKPKWKLKKILGLILAKIGKLFFILPPFSFLKKPATWLFYTLIREKDYYLADKNLKKTMKNILKVDLSSQLEEIKTPTLILWGEEDKITPLSDAYLMEQKIPQAKLVIWKDIGHSLPFKKSKELTDLIRKFCQE